MTRQFFRSKKKLLIALAVIIVCLVSLCCTFFPRSVTGLQIIPELRPCYPAQSTHALCIQVPIWLEKSIIYMGMSLTLTILLQPCFSLFTFLIKGYYTLITISYFAIQCRVLSWIFFFPFKRQGKTGGRRQGDG